MTSLGTKIEDAEKMISLQGAITLLILICWCLNCFGDFGVEWDMTE